jgi:hypothetical protein
MKTYIPKSIFLKQIYRSLARVLRKLCRMALTLELRILWFAISYGIENPFVKVALSSWLPLVLTKPYNKVTH